MRDMGDSYHPLSGASLGLGTTAGGPSDPFQLPPDARYSDGGVLGRGGMGEIRTVHDRCLGRTVAFKVSTCDGARGEQRLIDEARLTAGLVHPGIVAVYDAGCLEDGRPFYTMPVFRGRSLAEAATGASLEARVRLVRHFLHACEAVAYAHSEGVLHRDLKPANILVGRFGETVVADWGLGCRIDSGSGSSHLPVGTPEYMSPEQARGLPLSPASDVFSLGISLHELITGIPPVRKSGARSGDSPRRRGPSLPAPRYAGLPAELLAIASQATRTSPGDRYPDARALADDVLAWLEGRRVAAHRYTLRELAGRLWAAYRGPLLVGCLAVVGIALAASFGYWRTTVQQERTRLAEGAALKARARADAHLARAEVAEALEATERDDWATAELLASSALMLEESTDARGVLARFDGRARPRLVRRLVLPDCDHLAVSSRGDRVACSMEGRIHLLAPGQALQELARIDVGEETMAFSSDAGALMVNSMDGRVHFFWPEQGRAHLTLEVPGTRKQFGYGADGQGVWLGGNAEFWADMSSGQFTVTRMCSGVRSIPVAVASTAAGERLTLCQDGSLHGAPNGPGEARERIRLEPSLGIPLDLALSPTNPHRAAISLVGGGAAIVDLEHDRVLRVVGADMPAPFDLALSGDRLAMSDGRGSVRVWEVETGILVTGLPAVGARVRWLDDGRNLRIVSDAVEDWLLPEKPHPPHVHHSPAGVAALSVSADQHRFVSAHGDGRVRLQRVERAEPLAESPLHWSVVKDVELSPDGRHAVAICAQDTRLFIIDLEHPSDIRALPASAGARVAWLEGDLLVLAPYDGGLMAWQGTAAGTEPIRFSGSRVLDMESDADRRGVTLRDREGRVMRLEVAARPVLRVVAEGRGGGYVAGSRDRVVLLSNAKLEVFQPGSSSRSVHISRADATEMALSPDGRWIALGHQDGTVSVWSVETLEVRAILRGHVGRISALAFDPSGERLFSGSWDGDVRVWSMSSMDVTPASLLARAQSAWGITVEEVLFGRKRRPI